MKRLFGAALLLVAITPLASTASGQVTKSGAGYQFRIKYTKGQKLNYDLAMNMTLPKGAGPQGAGGSMKLTGPVHMTVTDVKASVATIHVEVGPMAMNGRAAGKPRTVDFQVNATGKTSGPSAPGMDQLMSSLPGKPLKLGESFSNDNNIGRLGQSVHVKRTSRFTGIRNVAGRQVAVFDISVAATGATSASAKGMEAVAMSDGTLVQTSLTQTGASPQGSVRQTVTLVRK